MRYDNEHKQKTRAKVLQAAARALRSEGPERVGVAAVMAEAGLTHGGFYAHFKSKDELIAAAIGHMFDESRERAIKEIEGRDPAGPGRLHRLLSLAGTPRCTRPRLPDRSPVVRPPAPADGDTRGVRQRRAAAGEVVR